MTIRFNDGNKYLKEIKRIFKNQSLYIRDFGKWGRLPRDFFKKLILHSDQIIKNEYINIEEIGLDEKQVERFKVINSKRLDDNKFIKQQYTDEIIVLLKKYIKSESTREDDYSTDNTFDYSYVDFIEFDDDFSNNTHLSFDDDIIYPDINTSYLDSVMRNLFYNKDVVYAFNKNIPSTNSITDASSIKTGKFKITSYNGFFDYPTKFKVICKARTSHGECGNIAFFNDSHLFTALKCTISLNNLSENDKGHTIIKPEKITACENRRFYSYTGKFSNGNEDDAKKEMIIVSLFKIDRPIIEANFVFVNSKGADPFVLIIAIKNSENMIARVEKILSDEKKTFLLHDLYDNIREYYKKNHSLNINNKNKIVAHYLTLQALNQYFFKHRGVGFVAGESGSGKSFISKIISNLFSFDHGLIKGTNITQPGFLGGKGSVSGLFGRSLWRPGLIETHDLLTIDECTESLLTFLDEKDFSKTNNIFYLLKLTEDGGKRGIIEAETTNPNAAMIMFGNLNVLNSIHKYYKESVRRLYNKYSDGGRKNGIIFNNNWPLFRPVRYYTEKLKNAALGKAHAKVRLDQYKDKHYVTNLNEPNQGRIDWQLIIEHDTKKYESYDYSGDENISFYHREQFIEELETRFNKITRPPANFVKSVHNFIIKDYFNNEPNNFITHKYDNVKRQLFNRVVTIMSNMIWLNKYWMRSDNNAAVIIELTDEEKDWIRYYLKFNYNTLNEDEAAMIVHPYTNDISITYDDLDTFDAELQQEHYDKKQKERDDTTVVLFDSAFEVDEK